jgi:hypothetical protein
MLGPTFSELSGPASGATGECERLLSKCERE